MCLWHCNLQIPLLNTWRSWCITQGDNFSNDYNYFLMVQRPVWVHNMTKMVVHVKIMSLSQLCKQHTIEIEATASICLETLMITICLLHLSQKRRIVFKMSSPTRIYLERNTFLLLLHPTWLFCWEIQEDDSVSSQVIVYQTHFEIVARKCDNNVISIVLREGNHMAARWIRVKDLATSQCEERPHVFCTLQREANIQQQKPQLLDELVQKISLRHSVKNNHFIVVSFLCTNSCWIIRGRWLEWGLG